MAQVSETAPAKINLGLRIVGRRADGYHLLDSIFVFTKQGDALTFKASDTLSLSVEGPFASLLNSGSDHSENLVYRAAKALQEVAGVTRGAEIRLVKNLPLAAGIGGGSSDAAATLRGLSRLWGIGLDEPELIALSLKLGADVAACLTDLPKRVQGVGDQITVLNAGSAIPIFLMNPLKPLETPEIFKRYKEAGRPFRCEMGELASPDEIINDLEPEAFGLLPELSTVIAELASLNGARLARMSGSGATVFALFESNAQARDAYQTMRARYPEWWCYQDLIIPPTSLSHVLFPAS